MTENAIIDPAALAERSERVAETALRGCAPETYEEMAALLADAVSLIPDRGERYRNALNSVMKALLSAQERNDLVKIADFLGFELPYVLRNC